MRKGPIIAPGAAARTNERQRIAADGKSFAVHEWRGSGPPYLHVHHEDDEGWHVLRFAARTVEARAGSTVFVPAGVAHTYEAFEEARYLVILTPRLRALIAELQAARDRSGDDEIFRRHSSEVLE